MKASARHQPQISIPLFGEISLRRGYTPDTQIVDIRINAGIEEFLDIDEVVDAAGEDLGPCANVHDVPKTGALRIASIRAILTWKPCDGETTPSSLAAGTCDEGRAAATLLCQFPAAAGVALSAVAAIEPPVICRGFHTLDVLEAGLNELYCAVARSLKGGILSCTQVGNLCASGHETLEMMRWIDTHRETGARLGLSGSASTRKLVHLLERGTSFPKAADGPGRYEAVATARSSWRSSYDLD